MDIPTSLGIAKGDGINPDVEAGDLQGSVYGFVSAPDLQASKGQGIGV
jgi:hypothetical protein